MRVGDTLYDNFDREIASYFAGEYGSGIGFGYIDRTAIPSYSVWSRKHLGGAFSSVPAPFRPATAPDGYYLFKGGQVIGYHAGGNGATMPMIPPQTKNGFWATVGHALAGSLAMQEARRKAAQQAILHFERLLNPTDPPGGERPASGGRWASGSSGPDAGAPMTLAGAYSLLGVAPTASDEEVRAAFHDKQQRNHPDKLDHLDVDDEIRAFADRRAAQINEAYNLIKESRRRIPR